MKPDSRSAQRFFEGLAEACPIPDLDHLFLVHWPADLPSPAAILLPMGFRGTVVTGRHSIFQRLRQHHPRHEVRLDDHPTAGQASHQLLMELMPGKEATRWNIQRALQQLQAGGQVWLFGSRETGIASLVNLFPEVQTIYYKGHMRLVRLAVQPAAPVEPAYHTLMVQDTPLATLPGLFSWNRPDPASLLLLSTITDHPGGRVLDFGCGNGLLGISLAKKWPDVQVILSDDLYLAVRCAGESIRLNDLSQRCRAIVENGVGEQLARQRFHMILSNPPFHRGTRSDYQTAQQFLGQAAAILEPAGEIRVVGSRFLDYGSLMSSLLAGVTVLAQDGNFVVWRGFRSNNSRG